MATSKQKAGNATPRIVSLPSAQQPALQFGSILKEHRKKARISQKDFADMMHVTRNTIINWEADKSKPDYSLIPEVCTLLNIKLHELFRMQAENGLSDLEERVVGNLRQLNPTSRRVIDKMISTMVDEELRAKDQTLKKTFALFLQRPGTVAAGVGSYVPEEAPEYVFLRKNHINARADGIVLVNGNSMEPVYHNGDYVYYEEASSADPGEDAIVDTDDGAVIKRVDDDHTLYDLFSMDDPTIKYTARQQMLVDEFSDLSEGHKKAVENLVDTLSKVEAAENCPDLSVLTYYSRQLAAGFGDPTEFDDEGEEVYVYSSPDVARADCIFTVNGNSMEPDFRSGQDVLVQRIPNGPDLKYGEIGAFIIGNETYIKEYQEDGLHSLNPDYKPMHFDDSVSVYLIGRVLGILDKASYATAEDISKYEAVHGEE